MVTIADADKFINDGPFWEKYPDTYPLVTRYERTTDSGHILESWERGDDYRMHETTRRDQNREKIRLLEEQIAKMEAKK